MSISSRRAALWRVGSFLMGTALGSALSTHPAGAQSANQEPPACRVEPIAFEGWQAQQLSNSWVKLIIVPQLAGRLMQVIFDGHPYLFVNPEYKGQYFPPSEAQGKHRWFNYGGDKIWPMPEVSSPTRLRSRVRTSVGVQGVPRPPASVIRSREIPMVSGTQGQNPRDGIRKLPPSLLISCALRPCRCHLAGSFGLFFPGRLEARLYDAQEGSLLTVMLRKVSLNKGIDLNEDIAAPATAERVSLHLIDSQGKERGAIGSAKIRPRQGNS